MSKRKASAIERLPAHVTARQKEEYDRFGPWAYLVTKPEDMPPHFDPWYEELRDATIMLKLPRDVERRDTSAGKDLYIGLLAARNDRVTYLSLDGEEVKRRDLLYTEVVAVALSQELLLGGLRIDLASGDSLTVEFNTVSAELFGDFASSVARMCSGPSASTALRVPDDASREPSVDDTLFYVLLRDLRARDPRFRVLAFQAACSVKAGRDARASILSRFASSLIPWKLDGCLLAATPDELAFFYAGPGEPRLKRSRGHSYVSTFIPASALKGAMVELRTLIGGAVFRGAPACCAGP